MSESYPYPNEEVKKHCLGKLRETNTSARIIQLVFRRRDNQFKPERDRAHPERAS
ncbi:hypothetical protein VB711_22460 [Cronbergia sp. UHCC 0137]|uniref:hypothetical protein n=1 Tax=Cronbergia sp. UHCC 0137 TaxID=3110239 RepID=UPI002B21ABC9|nr:hypothetical protein [Cronbergia sp. UHCC 0137]MEA5620580.1 hypothetical protein [Cronbergia sp. UHCC 0137]